MTTKTKASHGITVYFDDDYGLEIKRRIEGLAKMYGLSVSRIAGWVLREGIGIVESKLTPIPSPTVRKRSPKVK